MERNGHSAQRTATRDRRVTETPAQRIDGCLRRGTPGRGHVGQITVVGRFAGDQRMRAYTDQTEINAVRLLDQQRTRQIE